MSQAEMIDSDNSLNSKSGAELVPISLEVSLLRQKIVASLRRAIELGTLKAGERLIEKDLCARLGVSRTSLREALRDLEANGIVTKVSARELVIRPLSVEDAINLYRIRGALETLVAEQFIERASDSDVERLRAALLHLRSTEPASGPSLDARRDYYQIWCNAAQNPFAFEFLMNLQLRLSVMVGTRLRKPALFGQNIVEKQTILDCMARRDVAAVRDAVRDHIRSATKATLPDSAFI